MLRDVGRVLTGFAGKGLVDRSTGAVEAGERILMVGRVERRIV